MRDRDRAMGRSREREGRGEPRYRPRSRERYNNSRDTYRGRDRDRDRDMDRNRDGRSRSRSREKEIWGGGDSRRERGREGVHWQRDRHNPEEEFAHVQRKDYVNGRRSLKERDNRVNKSWSQSINIERGPKPRSDARKSLIQSDTEAKEDGKVLPSCLTGRAPVMKGENFKRQLAASFEVENNIEEDDHRLAQRFKQISYGKNTVAYDRYVKAVPKNRRAGYDIHPRTPDAYDKVSKRVFDGRIKAWRRKLHDWDENVAVSDESTTLTSEDTTHLAQSDDIANETDALDHKKVGTKLSSSTGNCGSESIVDIIIGGDDGRNLDDISSGEDDDIL